MTDDESRRQYEAAMTSRGWFVGDRYDDDIFCLGGDLAHSRGDYKNPVAELAWTMWQEARAATLAHIREGAIYDFIANKAIVRIEAIGCPENVLQPAADAVESTP